MWIEKDNALYKRFEFTSFVEAFSFMTKVAFLSEKANHHPKWTNVYNVVEVWLNTHSAGNRVTEKDTRLASEIDALL